MDIKHSERGMVSILVTIIMMIVISLIILGISQVTRSNRREQLDQQLSTQAYYAAESGLNRAVRFFAEYPTADLDTNGNCTQFITSAPPNGLQAVIGVGNVLDADTKVSYTCLMVNSKPASLQKAPLTQDSNTVWRVRDAAGLPFTQLEFKWGPNDNTQFTGSTSSCAAADANCCNPLNFTQYGTWKCAFGILRVDLVDTHGTVASSALQNPAKTLYLVPTFTSAGATTPQALTATAGQVIYVKCTADLCDIKLTPAVASNEYFARLTMIYQDANTVQLSGTDVNGAANFAGGQAVIDVTGKAQDQVRRLQARIPLVVGNAPMPNFVLQSTDDVCKMLKVAATVTSTDSCSP